MQLSSPAAPPALPPPLPEVRAPWPDELPRLRHFLPEAYLYSNHPLFLVGAEGPAERLVAVGALVNQPWQENRQALLYLRAAPGEREVAWTTALIRRALDRAQVRGLDSLNLGQTFPEDSVPARVLADAGFLPTDRNEIYSVAARPMWERLHLLHERLQASRMVPPGVRLSTLQPGLLDRVRRFLLQHMPAGASLLTLEAEGYKPEHSLALLVHGELKGVLLCRRSGNRSFVGLRVVVPELRGGIGWANLVLLHASMGTTVQSGLEECHFELNPDLHVDTRQMAQLFGARLIGRRVILRAALPKNA